MQSNFVKLTATNHLVMYSLFTLGKFIYTDITQEPNSTVTMPALFGQMENLENGIRRGLDIPTGDFDLVGASPNPDTNISPESLARSA